MRQEIERVKTGIQGLDKALEGGIPKGNLVLVSGGAGTGKSTLCLQFLINGAQILGERGLYISTEQNEVELRKLAENFGWDLKRLESENFLKILYFNIVESDNFLKKVGEAVDSFNPKRIVVDSLTTLTDSLLISDLGEGSAFSLVQIAETVSPIPKTERVVTKTILYHLINTLKRFNRTILLTSELPEQTANLSADTITEFICDGVITMHYLGIGGADTRTLRIRKMRYSDHIKSYLPYNIETKEGIVVDIEGAMDVLMK